MMSSLELSDNIYSLTTELEPHLCINCGCESVILALDHPPVTQMIDSESMYDDDRRLLAANSRDNLKLPLPVASRQSEGILSPLGVALTTPDLENFITASSLALSTSCTTPTAAAHFLKNTTSATTEQEEYARGFEAALQRIQQEQAISQYQQRLFSTPTTSTTSIMSSASETTAALPSAYHFPQPPPTRATQIPFVVDPPVSQPSHYPKQAAYTNANVDDSFVDSLMLAAARIDPRLKPSAEQIVPGTPPPPPPPQNPLHPQFQEELKRRRKKERNRVAASKCRKRRLEREADLEEKVKSMKTEYGDLMSEANQLRQIVFKLKQLVMAHVNGGCNVMMEQAGIGGAAATA
eukprot:m.14255 g.14255  ORF g.14255 m.14255 type:complete len:351 (+) comp25647_c0_seq5:1241-2293(+)